MLVQLHEIAAFLTHNDLMKKVTVFNNCFQQCFFYANKFLSKVIFGFNLCKYMLLTNYIVYHYR